MGGGGQNLLEFRCAYCLITTLTFIYSYKRQSLTLSKENSETKRMQELLSHDLSTDNTSALLTGTMFRHRGNISLLHVRVGWGYDTFEILSETLGESLILEAFLLVKQNSKYTKKIDSVLQGLRKYEVSPHRLVHRSTRDFRCEAPCVQVQLGCRLIQI